ncbi:MAG: hypothetical protein Q9169_007664 [Polycauliona sp. 2 TL-2023]
MDTMANIRDNGPHTLPFNGNAPLRRIYTGIGPIDYQLTVLSLFFYNIVDGTHPQACLQAYHFAGQLEHLERGIIDSSHSIVVWGMSMQLATFAVVVPIYFAIHLWTSPTVSSRTWSDIHVGSPKLDTIPYSVDLGFILPAILLALPAPSIISYDTKQMFMAVWQVFPLTVGLLQLVAPTVRFGQEIPAQKTKKQTIVPMRKVYATTLAIATVTRISTWTISISAVVFPSIFASEMSGLLKPLSVFIPSAATSSAKMPSIAAAAIQLLQYDEIISSTAMQIWSAALYLNIAGRRGPAGWASLIIVGAVIEAFAGKLGFAVAAVWARDEIIFAGDDKEKKKL